MVHVKKLIQDKNTRECVRWYDKRGRRMYDYVKINNRLMDFSYKVIQQDRLWWGGFISTVWLGLDHNLSMSSNRKPLIFETMLFFNGKDAAMIRYSTLKEAQRGHEEMKKSLNLKTIFYIITEHYRRELYWKKYEIKNYLKKLYEKAFTRPQSDKSN